MQVCLMKLALAMCRSDVQLSNTFDISTLLHLIVSNPDGPDWPLVLIAAFLTNCSFISSKLIGWITGSSLLKSVSS